VKGFLERVMAQRQQEQVDAATLAPPVSRSTETVRAHHESMRALKRHELPKLLRLIRAGLSQRQVATALGVSQGTVAKALNRARVEAVES
jgi:DNA-directed RNA polymerase specialized sigma24 family protein